MRWALIVVAFVEKAQSEVYAGQESFERDWPVGGVITNHTVPGFPPFLLFGARLFLVSLPSKVEEVLQKELEN